MRSGDGTSDVRNTSQPAKRRSIRRWLVLTVALCAPMALLTTEGVTHSVDYDCADFKTQRAAQDHRNTHPTDPDELDDANGVACPELPCPCGATELPPPAPSPVRAAPTEPLAMPATTQARVTQVVDAGTLRVRLPAGHALNVRLIGIDVPKPRGRRTPAACGAADATALMRRLAFRDGVGRRVRLTSDPTHARAARSERPLAYVDARGVDLGRAMIASGWAKVDTLDWDFMRLGSYRQAQHAARAAGRGAWRMCGSP